MRTLPQICLLILALITAGCATGGNIAAPAGFPELFLSPEEGNTLLFTRPDMDLARFRKIFVEPVRIEAPGATRVSDQETAEIGEYARSRFTEALAETFTIADGPGDDVLRIRFTLVDLQPTGKAQVVMMVPPFAMVNMLAPKGPFTGSLTLAGEFYEGTDTEPSVAFVAYRTRPGVDATVAFRRLDAAKRIIDNGARRLAQDLESLEAATK